MINKNISNIIFLFLVILLFSGTIIFRDKVYDFIFMVRSKVFIDKEYSSKDVGLIEENLVLKERLSKMFYLEQDNELLRSAIETKHKTQSNIVEANIIGFDSSMEKSLTILNVGEDIGVKPNQAIVYKGYFVGKITEVSRDRSKAEFINSNQSNIGVRIQNELNSEGILKSNYGIEIFIDLIPKTETVNLGDFIYTSGIGDIK